MAKKQVIVLLRRTPLNSVKGSEALRHSVGLTLAENQVSAILMGPAAWLAVSLHPEQIEGETVKKHIDMLLRLKAEVKVEAEALERYGIERGRILPGIKVVPREEIVAALTGAEAVIPF